MHAHTHGNLLIRRTLKPETKKKKQNTNTSHMFIYIIRGPSSQIHKQHSLTDTHPSFIRIGPLFSNPHTRVPWFKVERHHHHPPPGTLRSPRTESTTIKRNHNASQDRPCRTGFGIVPTGSSIPPALKAAASTRVYGSVKFFSCGFCAGCSVFPNPPTHMLR